MISALPDKACAPTSKYFVSCARAEMTESPDEDKVRCVLVLEFASPAEAEKIHRSIALDNQGYISTRVVGSSIRAEVTSSSLNSLLHTLDDFLACASVAEKVVSKRA
jgi:tRNA threonylcarbamoyladenosine modification (KEOPS) complex  Pcc1 subunit